MPQPTARQLHVDSLLTQISIAHSNPDYIVDGMFPVVPVQKQSDLIPAYDQSPWFRDDARPRAPGTASRGGGFTVDTSDNYFCNRFSRRYEIADDIRGNVDQPFNLDQDAARFVADKILMRREVAFAVDFFTTSVWGTDVVGDTDFIKWSNFGSSTPIQDVDDFKDTVELLIGREPNSMSMGKGGWIKLKNHPTLIDRIKYTQRAQLTVELVASLLEMPKLLIGRSIQTTDPEGTAEGSVTYSRIWGDNALMMYVPEAASLLNPAAGYTFVWTVVANALNWIKRMRNEEREVDIIEGNTYFDQKITSARSGIFLSNVV